VWIRANLLWIALERRDQKLLRNHLAAADAIVARFDREGLFRKNEDLIWSRNVLRAVHKELR
jgi:hypothetical protein